MRSEDVNYSLTETTPSFTRSVQSHLGEVVFVELPEPGATVAAGGSFGNVESVKATSDVKVVEVNVKLSYGCHQYIILYFTILACFFGLW